MAGWGPALAIKLHGRLTQGCLGRKETHRSVSGRVNSSPSSISTYSPSSPLVVSSRCPVPGVWPLVATTRCLGAEGETLVCSLLSVTSWMISSSSENVPGVELTFTWHWPAPDSWRELGGILRWVTKDCRACWHRRLEFEQNYKELIPSRPFSPPTPTVPGLGAHIMLTLSQLWPGCSQDRSVPMRRSSLFSAHPT